MPIKASAKKELRKGKRRQARNLARKNALKNSVKSVKKLFSAGQIDEAKKLIAAAYQAIDKAARRHQEKHGGAQEIPIDENAE